MNVFSANNKSEARALLVRALNDNSMDESFLKDDNGDSIAIFREEEEVRLFNEIIAYGGFNDKQTAYTALHSCFTVLLDDISEWMVSEGVTKTFYMEADEIIGYIIDKNGNKENTATVRLSLRKERGNNTELGFFVNSFYPVDNNPKT